MTTYAPCPAASAQQQCARPEGHKGPHAVRGSENLSLQAELDRALSEVVIARAHIAELERKLAKAQDGGWVRVNERWPEQWIRVLVWDGVDVEITSKVDALYALWANCNAAVTHWRPLPPPPAPEPR